MRPKKTYGIVLRRINYSESDRVLTILTKDFGKVSLIAKGVRKEKSKLAGGIELFSINEIGYIESNDGLSILTNSRLIKHYSGFLGSLEKVKFAYDCYKKIDKIIEINADEDYFLLTQQLLRELDRQDSLLSLIELWWLIRLLTLNGHDINTDILTNNQAFQEDQKYIFINSKGSFKLDDYGQYFPEHIKLLRLIKENHPSNLTKIRNVDKLSNDLLKLTRGFMEFYN